MARKIDLDAVINRIRMAMQGSHPASPDSGYDYLYVISGSPHGGLYLKDPAGRQIGPFITGSTGGGGFTPSHYSFPPLAPDSNTNFNTVSASLTSDYYLLSNGTQNDEAIWNVNLPAGTYKWVIFHFRGNDRGKYHLLLDGVDVGNVDGYNAGTALTVSSVTGIAVAGASPTEVKIKMSDKNASSGGYYGLMFWNWLIRTGS